MFEKIKSIVSQAHYFTKFENKKNHNTYSQLYRMESANWTVKQVATFRSRLLLLLYLLNQSDIVSHTHYFTKFENKKINS